MIVAMPNLTIAAPETVGFDPTRLQRAYAVLQRWIDTDRMPAAALCVGRNGRIVQPRFFGRQRPEQGAPALRDDALFLIASITKPVTVTAVMMLVERGQLALEDRVAEFVPAFARNGKQDVRIRHLLTHTSGLPDMLPNNVELRRAASAVLGVRRGDLQAAARFSRRARASTTRAWAPRCWPRSSIR